MALMFQRTVYQMKKFNLRFSKRDNPCSMKTSNEWIINGSVTYKRVSKNGLWLTVKSKASRSGLYTSEEMTFDCFIPYRLVKNKKYTNLHTKGRFDFYKDETFFIVSEILEEVK